MGAIPAALLLMAFNAVMSALDTVFVRLVAGEVHPLEIAFFRNLFSLITLFLILPRGERTLDGNGLWPLHGLRAVIKLAAMLTYFVAITMLPIALVTAIAFSMPLFVVVGSMMFLGEGVGRHRLIALGAGLAGMLIILRPPGVEAGLGFALAVLSAILFAGVALLMKVSSGREAPLRIVWCNLLVTVPVALVVALPVWVWPSPQALTLMALQGIGGLFAQLSVARSMKLADASLVIPVDFLRLPIAAFLGLALFGEPLEIWVLVGGAVIFAGVVYSARTESRLSRLSS